MNAKNNNTYLFGRTHNTGVKELMAGTPGKSMVLPQSPWPRFPHGWVSCEKHSNSVWQEKQLEVSFLPMLDVTLSLCRGWEWHHEQWGDGRMGRCPHLPRNHGPEKRGMEGMAMRESHRNRGTVQDDAHGWGKCPKLCHAGSSGLALIPGTLWGAWRPFWSPWPHTLSETYKAPKSISAWTRAQWGSKGS